MSGLSKSTTCARECHGVVSMNIHTHIAPSLHANQKPNRQTYLLCKSNGLAAQLVPSLRDLRQHFAHGVCISVYARPITVEPNLTSVQGWKLCSLKRWRQVEPWCEHYLSTWDVCEHIIYCTGSISIFNLLIYIIEIVYCYVWLSKVLVLIIIFRSTVWIVINMWIDITVLINKYLINLIYSNSKYIDLKTRS